MALLTRKPRSTATEGTAEARPTRRQKWAKAKQAMGPWGLEGTSATKAFLMVIVAAVLAGPAALALQVGRSAPAPIVGPPSSQSSVPDTAHAQQRAVGAAVDFMTLWQSSGTADREAVAAKLMYPPETIALPKERPSDSPTLAVVDAVADEAGVWQVMVSARSATSAQTWRVEVAVSDAAATVVALPGPVPTPQPQAGRVGGVQPLGGSHPAAQTAAGFIESFLTGRGDVSRWTSPQAAITAVDPAVCSKTTVGVTSAPDPAQSPQTGEELDVVVTIDCTGTEEDAGVASSTFSYGLALQGRDGRWEVAGFVSVDQVLREASPAPEPPAASQSPTQTPETPTSPEASTTTTDKEGN